MSIELLLPVVTSPPSPPGVKSFSAPKTDQMSFEEILQNQMTRSTSPADKPSTEKSVSDLTAEKPQAVTNESIVSPKNVQGEDKPEDKKEDIVKTEETSAIPFVNPQVMGIVADHTKLVITSPDSEGMVDAIVSENLNTDASDPKMQKSQSVSAADIQLAEDPKVQTTNDVLAGLDAKTTAGSSVVESDQANMAPKLNTAATDSSQSVPLTDEAGEPVEAPIQSSSPLESETLSTKEGQRNDAVVTKSGSADLEVEQGEIESETAVASTKPESMTKSVSTNKVDESKSNDPTRVIIERNGIKDTDPPPDKNTGQTVAPPTTGIDQTVGKTAAPYYQSSEPARLAEAQTTNILQQITNQLDGLTRSGRQTLRIQLSPQDLGTIDLKVTHSQHGVSVSLMAENGATGKLLETQVSQLRQTLMDAGVQINQLHVGVHSGSSQSNHSQAQENHQKYSNPQPNSFTSSTNNSSPELKQGNSLVDYKI